MDDDIEKADYFIKRHNLRVAEDKTDPFKEAEIRRNLLVLNQQSSISLASNATTCHLLEDDLNACASVVDARDKGKVNNYADAAVFLASNCKSDSKEWKSHIYKQKGLVNDIISKLKCQNCLNWEAPKQLSNLFSGSSDNPGGTTSPSPVRKNSDKAFPVLRDFPTLVLPKETNISALGNILKPEGQGSNFKSDQSSRPDFSSATALGKSTPTTPPVQPFTRFNFNTVRSEDEPNLNKSFPSRLVPDSTVSDAGFNWNAGKPVNPPRDFQSNLKELPTNNYDDYYGNVPPGRGFQRNDRGGGYGQRCGRGYRSAGARHFTDDQYRGLEDSSDAGMSNTAGNFFKTARDELVDQNAKKNNGYGRGQGGGYGTAYNSYDNGNLGGARGGLQYGAQKRSLGTSRRGGGVFSKFVPPVRPEGEDQSNRQGRRNDDSGENGEVDERLKNIDPKMIELIKNEIMDISAPVCWDDIAGLEFAKSTIQEIVVWPMMRPDIFTGLRKPPKGLLLFGPPGTGKTLIGKCIASQSQSTFFSISASSLTSKWIGDGEKMVRALFAVAKCHQPAVVFIDEIDSLLTQRSDTEHESSRRIKTEFLVQLDGAGTGDEERILVVGATNRPQELDEAARRRLVKRLYIPLPEFEARRQIVERLMSSERSDLSPDEIIEIARLTEGYSGADMKNVCQEASLGPIRSLSFSDMHQISAEQVRPVNFQDFKTALQRVRASVSQKDLDQYVTWDQTYGMSGGF